MGITANRLRAVLSYDPDTGIFRWLVGARRGRVADSVDVTTGYHRIKVDGASYGANRLAWLYMSGEWPADQVDHRNTVRSDNRWDNLRAATGSQNKANGNRYSNNTSGIKGVSPSGRRNKPWSAVITKDGFTRRLGRYVTKEEADAAYRHAANHLHGEFARVGV